MSQRSVAIVGAGMAGLSCAHRLLEQGCRVSLFEKARGLGGRLSQRRIHDAGFDLGAQYATARSSEFQSFLRSLGGQCDPWRGRIVARTAGMPESAETLKLETAPVRWVGVASMQQWARALGERCASFGRSFELHLATRIEAIESAVANQAEGASSSPLILRGTSGGPWGPFDHVVCTAPPEQAAVLVEPWPEAHGLANGVSMRPCIALVLLFDREVSPASSGQANAAPDAMFCNGEVLSWVAREGSKPQRGHHGWTLHAAADWSARHWDRPVDELTSLLVAAFRDQLRVSELPEVLASYVHRWRYAQAEQPLELGSWIASDARLLLAGDWLNGSRVEGAYLSGLHAAGRLL